MPCVPIGMATRRTRTSRLKRFLSMPRYAGASRSRMKRGIATQGDTAAIQASGQSRAVWSDDCLPAGDLVSESVGGTSD